MQNSEILAPLGWAIIVISVLAIVVPVIRRKSDALTFWNLFLLGGIMFNGIGCLEVVYGTFNWPELLWFQPRRRDVHILATGMIVFYVTIFVAHYVFSKPIGKLVGRFFNKWPPQSLTLTLTVVSVTLVISVLSMVFSQVFYLNALFINLSQKAIVFAVVFAFCHWFNHKRQLPMLGLFLGVFAYCALFAMVTYVGRRLLISVVAAPLFSMYWLKWRYASPKYILAGMGVACALVFVATGFYSTFRHARGIHGMNSERSFANVIKAMTSTTLNDQVEYFRQNSLHFFSQYTVHYSLLTIQLVENRELNVDTLNAIRFLIAYPFPRALWPGKPEPTGNRIVNGVLHLGVATNWGLGIVGHGWQEGGYPVIVLYGILMVIVLKLMDDALRRHPDNPFLLATLAAGAPHVIAWNRGDTCTMSAEILEAFAFVWIVGLTSRFVFGTKSTPGRTASLQPPLESIGGQYYQLKR